MSKAPRSVGVDQPIEVAAERMAELDVRHLPVLEGGALIGVISDRDIALASAAAPGLPMRVEEAMSAVPYRVDESTPLAEAVEHLASRKLGCAIVTRHDHVVGMFTLTDALSVLGDLLGAPPLGNG
jgi:acetoin utilization protein AcuB